LEDKKINKVHIHGKQAIGLIKQFINGTTAKTKRLNANIWNTSLEFRRGVIDGLTATDEYVKENNIIHTTNKKLVDDLVELCNSIGIITKIKINKRNSRSFKKDKTDYVEFTSYELNKTTKYETKKLEFGEFTLIPITNIRTIPSKSSKVYNFTVDTKEHLYELPNGIITHQCPLTKDTRVPFKVGDNKYKCTSIENIYKDYGDNPKLKV
jgi:ribonucleoside-triphosphate reductase